MASRRAFADEYAVRVNRAVELLADRSAADAVRALQVECALSERQALRYVNAAIECRHADSRGLTLSATVAEAVQSYLGHERHGGRAR